MLLAIVTGSIPLGLNGIRAYAARGTNRTTTSMSTVTQLTGTTASHCDVAASAIRIAAVEKKNSMAMMCMDMAESMDTEARLTGGANLLAVSMPIVEVHLLKIQFKNRERQVTSFFCIKYARLHGQFLPRLSTKTS